MERSEERLETLKVRDDELHDLLARLATADGVMGTGSSTVGDVAEASGYSVQDVAMALQEMRGRSGLWAGSAPLTYAQQLQRRRALFVMALSFAISILIIGFMLLQQQPSVPPPTRIVETAVDAPPTPTEVAPR